jgi:hypothetical protein
LSSTDPSFFSNPTHNTHSFHEVARRELQRFVAGGVGLTFVFDNRLGVRACVCACVMFCLCV